MQGMEYRISATELARSVGEVLGKIRFRRDSFVIERNGEPVARMAPLVSSEVTVAEAFGAWSDAGPADPGFADDLERVNRSDKPARNPWAS